ncbi:MAG TPA: TldD/PmbA family protein [Fibrobacteraceae bacterium]|nr:TldD/PmbA family protein [Fibrobacteraceae bacterium]
MNPSNVSLILQTGRDCGADFVELFEEETRSSVLTFKEKTVESANAGTDYGVGVRLLFGTEVLYAYSSDDSVESLVRLVRQLAFGRSRGKIISTSQVSAPNLASDQWSRMRDPRKLGQGFKLDFLRQGDAVARACSERITQVTLSIVDAVTAVEIFNSEGLSVRDERARTRFHISVTAGQGSERFSASEAPGFSGGYEVIDGLDVDALAHRAAERAVRMLDAPYLPGGQMPVVMGNGFGGVIFHEACGHPLETEAVRHKASPFCGKIGEQIAHPALTAIDDGLLPGLWGSLAVDDEGTPSQRTVLIENGILKAFMSDRVGATEVGVPRTGSARRESYKYAPVSRMRNTYIAAGKDSFEEMVASIDDGLYAAKMAGGSVNPATGEFNFAVEEGYRIRRGKIAEVVRGATLIGKGHEILPKISMIGQDSAAAAGMCGAASGSIPVTVGQPHLKVDRILVGGRA